MAIVVLPAPAVDEQGTWVLVDAANNTLTVYIDQTPAKRFDGIAIGRGGASATRSRGDGSTPTGRFTVGWINEDSPFQRFYGLNYPNRELTERAYRQGRINRAQRRAILAALRRGIAPPADTPLGGRIGIHGLGSGDPLIHSRFNWTQGCIALTNEQLRELGQWLHIGTPVIIH